MSWVYFTSGDRFPDGAVQGSYGLSQPICHDFLLKHYGLISCNAHSNYVIVNRLTRCIVGPTANVVSPSGTFLTLPEVSQTDSSLLSLNLAG